MNHDNPYISDIENKMNKILVSHNFATDWIHLRQQVPDDIRAARDALTQTRRDLIEGGHSVSLQKPSAAWKKAVLKFCDRIDTINEKIDEINFSAPLHLQQVQYDVEKEINKLSHQWQDTSKRR